MHCSRCGNNDPNLFGLRNGKYYCRACIKYKGNKANIKKYIKPKKVTPKLSYKLSNKQTEASNFIVNNEKEIYIDAVCGSGKTEIIFDSIVKALKEGKRVGYTSPRIEVTKEIYQRLKKVFPTLNISLVYGGNCEYLDGDIICLTCQQSYRYKDKFGLLIVDEYDAFPLNNDETLKQILRNSCYGKIVYLSGTFLDFQLVNKTKFSLNRRYHNYDIPVPIVEIGNLVFRLRKLVELILKNNDSLFVFVPTIKQGRMLRTYLSLMGINCILFSSKTIDRNHYFQMIKNKEIKTIITTTILERGITLKNLNVIVFNADHSIFNTQTLIQISGRVGRKKTCPTGNIIYIASKLSNEMDESIKTIVNKNNNVKDLSNMS